MRGKTGGFKRIIECDCGYKGEYLYIPSKRMTSCSQDGKRIMHGIIPAQVILTDDYCPGCHINLWQKLLKNIESGARLLKDKRGSEQ